MSGSEAIADLQGFDALGEGYAEAIVNATLHIDAVGGEAILPRGGEFRIDRDRHRLVEVGVIEDDQRRMTAKLHHQALHRRRALRSDQSADFRRAGEAHGAHARIFAHRSDDRRRAAGDDVEHACRQPGALAEFRQRQRRQRRFGRGMRDDGAAGGERGRGLAGQHRGGEVPRRHHADNADRFATDDHFGVRQMAGDAFGIEAFGFLGIPLDE